MGSLPCSQIHEQCLLHTVGLIQPFFLEDNLSSMILVESKCMGNLPQHSKNFSYQKPR